MSTELRKAIKRALRTGPSVQFNNGEGGLTMEEWLRSRRHFREVTGIGLSPDIAATKAYAEAYLRTPEGKAEVVALAAEMMEDDRRSRKMNETTEGISRADVDAAMGYLGIHNPKPHIPLEETVSGHEIVALARRVKSIEQELTLQRQAINAMGGIA
jgi:hypothetical protein